MSKKRSSRASEVTDEIKKMDDATVASDEGYEIEPPPGILLTREETKQKDAAKNLESSIPEKPKVSLRIFLASSKIRWDQTAGFAAYARRMKLGPMSIQDWRTAYEAFIHAPVC